MTKTTSLLKALQSKDPAKLRGLAIVAAAGALDSQLFSEIWAVVDGHDPPTRVTRVYEAVLQSRLVEKALDGRWRLRPEYRRPIEKCFKELGNGDLGIIHRFLASWLRQNGGSPVAETVDGRLAYSKWLRHHLLSTSDERVVITEAFERAFYKGWTGDGRAIVRIAEEARPELSARDCEFLAMRGLQHYKEGRYQEAIAQFDKVRESPDRSPTRLVAIALHLVGKHYGQKGQREKALGDLKESLEIGRQLNDRSHLAQVLHTRGQLYGRWGQREKALGDLKESLEIGRQLNDRSHLAQVLHTRGQLYGRGGQREKALDDLKASLEILRTLGDRHGMAQVLDTRAGLEIKQLKKRLAAGEDIEGAVWDVVQDLKFSLALDNRPKSRSIGYLRLYLAFELLGENALAAAALRLKLRVDRTRGSEGQHYLPQTTRRLRRLEQSLAEGQVDDAETRLLDMLRGID